ncbi:copper resistance system multicopper oxidase [Indioceanicola profundi]|uniref:copper resistance system multicopper oxidase n=1 Tax=Indioceanicola profundi TaxID=2220096 RepID=UPI000E6AC85A|nr:copper resistance system multicopper oxidase [Indioceanicola profundi]
MHQQKAALSRRDALKLAGAAGVAGYLTIYPGRRSFASSDQEYELLVENTRITIDGETTAAISMGGSIPAPTMRWREGQEIVVHVTNRMDEPTSIHWHGLLITGFMDGAPGFNGFDPIQPGQTFTYRFTLRQAGTYWYHSHSASQEQEGMYGAIVIEPAGRDPIRADRDYVVLLSDHTADNPETVLRKLKVSEGYYNYEKRTLLDFFRDVREDGFKTAWSDRRAWGQMRMDPTDLADVTGYKFLVNGKGPRDNWTALYKPGERVRLRIINGSAMTIFDLRIPGLPMTVVAADGQNVLPVKVDEFRFGVGETYDVIVNPTEDKPFTFFAESIDRTGYARATLATREGMEAEIPDMRPRAILTMEDMGMDHGAMGHGGMDHGAAPTGAMAGGAKPAMDHSAMGHGASSMDHSTMAAGAMDHSAMENGSAPMDHSSMGHGAADHSAMNHGAMDHSAMGHGSGGMDHSAMGHGEAAQGAMDHGAMNHGAMNHGAMNHGSGGMDHASMGHGSAGTDHAAMGHGVEAGAADKEAVGWADAGTPPGAKALSYADLKSLTKNEDLREPTQEIEVRLTGIMERYIWTLNGQKFGHGDPIRVSYGDRVRIRFVNTTMMAHPMHLHGMFMEVENGQTDRRPRKHVVLVPPGKTTSVVLTADEPGEWPFHCHLLYHMASGMMTRFIVEPRTASL